MNYSEILAESDFAVWSELAAKITSVYDIRIIEKPKTCLVMLPAKDCVEENPFYLGEVLITQAVVEINGQAGYGLVMEENPERALTFAIIDAVLNNSLPETKEIQAFLDEQQDKIQARRREENSKIAATRVNFAILEG